MHVSIFQPIKLYFLLPYLDHSANTIYSKSLVRLCDQLGTFLGFFCNIKPCADKFSFALFQFLDAESITNLRTAAATAVATKVFITVFFA